MLTIKQAAERLGVSRGLALKLVKSAKLRGHKFGAVYRVPEKAVEAYIKESEVKPYLDLRSLRPRVTLTDF